MRLNFGIMLAMKRIEEAYSNIGITVKWNGEGINLVGINSDSGEIMVRIDSKLYRTNDNMYLCGDSSKALSILGWKPKHKFSDIIKEMVNDEIKTHKFLLSNK